MIRVILFIGVLFFVGCHSSKKNKFEVPNPQQMAQILAEVHLSEAMVTNPTYGIVTDNQNRVFTGVLKKHQLTKSEFDSAVAYYSTNPPVYQKIYEQVIEILTQREMEVLALKEVEPLKSIKDSVSDLWIGERSFTFSTKESTVTRNIFSVIVSDSVMSGELVFTLNYQIKPFNRDSLKSLFIVDYVDDTKDSLHFDLPKDTISVQKNFEIKLLNKRVSKLSGQFVKFPVNRPITVSIKDIGLKWIPAKIDVNSKLKKMKL